MSEELLAKDKSVSIKKIYLLLFAIRIIKTKNRICLDFKSQIFPITIKIQYKTVLKSSQIYPQ